MTWPQCRNMAFITPFDKRHLRICGLVCYHCDMRWWSLNKLFLCRNHSSRHLSLSLSLSLFPSLPFYRNFWNVWPPARPIGRLVVRPLDRARPFGKFEIASRNCPSNFGHLSISPRWIQTDDRVALLLPRILLKWALIHVFHGCFSVLLGSFMFLSCTLGWYVGVKTVMYRATR